MVACNIMTTIIIENHNFRCKIHLRIKQDRSSYSKLCFVLLRIALRALYFSKKYREHAADVVAFGKWIFTRLGQTGNHSDKGYHSYIHSRGRIPLRISTKNVIQKILWRNFDFSVRKCFYAICIVFALCFLRILSGFPARESAILLFFKGNAIEFI